MLQETRLTCGDCDNSVGDLFAEISLGGFLHVSKNHGRNLFRRLQNAMISIRSRIGREWTCELLATVLIVNFYHRFPTFIHNAEWPIEPDFRMEKDVLLESILPMSNISL